MLYFIQYYIHNYANPRYTSFDINFIPQLHPIASMSFNLVMMFHTTILGYVPIFVLIDHTTKFEL